MKTIKTALILLITLFLLTSLLTIISDAANMPSSTKHRATVCYYCHVTKGFPVGGEDADCDNCHNIKDKLPILEQVHSNVCSGCHTLPSNDEQYHKLHTGIDCSKCHNGTGILPIKPTTGITNCAACHGVTFSGGSSSIHITHKPILANICTKCHGTKPATNPNGFKGVQLAVPGSSGVMNVLEGVSIAAGEINNQVYAKTIDYKRYTLYELFKVVFTVFH